MLTHSVVVLRMTQILGSTTGSLLLKMTRKLTKVRRSRIKLTICRTVKRGIARLGSKRNVRDMKQWLHKKKYVCKLIWCTKSLSKKCKRTTMVLVIRKLRGTHRARIALHAHLHSIDGPKLSNLIISIRKWSAKSPKKARRSIVALRLTHLPHSCKKLAQIKDRLMSRWSRCLKLQSLLIICMQPLKMSKSSQTQTTIWLIKQILILMNSHLSLARQS